VRQHQHGAGQEQNCHRSPYDQTKPYCRSPEQGSGIGFRRQRAIGRSENQREKDRSPDPTDRCDEMSRLTFIIILPFPLPGKVQTANSTCNPSLDALFARTLSATIRPGNPSQRNFLRTGCCRLIRPIDPDDTSKLRYQTASLSESRLKFIVFLWRCRSALIIRICRDDGRSAARASRAEHPAEEIHPIVKFNAWNGLMA
jgi:hypothetical protein